VLMPGEPERRRRAERLAHGIEVDERTWAEILDAARSLGLADDRIDALIA
jgi:hydroxycarboxylate dehydrogenase B